MENHSNTYQEFQHLLAKWRAGTITAKEQGRLINLAQEHPVYAEAWEGFQSDTETNHDVVLDRLKLKVKQRSNQGKQKERKSILIWIGRAAAVALFGVLSTWILWKDQNSEIPMADLAQFESEESIDMVPNDIISVESEASISDQETQKKDFENSTDQGEAIITLSVEEMNQPKPLFQKQFSAQISEPDAVAFEDEPSYVILHGVNLKETEFSSDLDPNSDQAKAVVVIDSSIDSINISDLAVAKDDELSDYPDEFTPEEESPIAIDSVSNKNQEALIVDAFEEEVNAELKRIDADTTTPITESTIGLNKLETFSNAMSPVEASRTIAGVVKGQSGEPLIGANISQIGTGLGTTTDIEGRFSLTLLDRSLPLHIDYVGYESQQISQDNVGSYVEVVLDEGDVQLSEIAVTGYDRNARKSGADHLGYTGEIIPSGGHKNFLKNLKKSIITYEGMAEDSTGQVILSIRLDNQGQPIQATIKETFNQDLANQIISFILKETRWRTKPAKMGGNFEYRFIWE